ncbi:hypothetical protein Tco_0889599 [Tanacetum coccineum]
MSAKHGWTSTGNGEQCGHTSSSPTDHAWPSRSLSVPNAHPVVPSNTLGVLANPIHSCLEIYPLRLGESVPIEALKEFSRQPMLGKECPINNWPEENGEILDGVVKSLVLAIVKHSKLLDFVLEIWFLEARCFSPCALSFHSTLAHFL